jgi:hypothetical protein
MVSKAMPANKDMMVSDLRETPKNIAYQLSRRPINLKFAEGVLITTTVDYRNHYIFSLIGSGFSSKYSFQFFIRMSLITNLRLVLRNGTRVRHLYELILIAGAPTPQQSVE